MSHANRGRTLEDAVEAQSAVYEAQGVASIHKAPTDWRIIRRGPEIVGAWPKAKGGVDFYGTLRGGIAVYFDAKETKVKTRFPFDNIHDHQIAFLKTQAALGAVTFVLVRMVTLDRAFLVDVEAIEAARKAGKASLSLAELEAGIECPMQGECPDYLAPILKLLEEAA